MTTTISDQAVKSTIVRFFSVPWPIRASFRILDRAAPAIGARWAERMWFTLPRPRPESRRSGDRPPAGSPFTLDLDGHEVVGESWGDGPPVYLLHGWAGHRRQFATMVGPLLAAGHRVVAFDALSHGESAAGPSGPRSATIPEFAAALAAAVSKFGQPHAVVAHSMGATATAVALCDGLRARRLVMLAPMASPKTYARQFAMMLGFGESTYDRLVTRVERRVGLPMKHFDVPELGRAIAMPPTLIIHDRDDRSIPVADGAAIAAAWPGASLQVTSGLGHRRVLHDRDVIARVVDFVTS